MSPLSSSTAVIDLDGLVAVPISTLRVTRFALFPLFIDFDRPTLHLLRLLYVSLIITHW